MQNINVIRMTALAIIFLLWFSCYIEASSVLQDHEIILLVTSEKAPIYLEPNVISPIIGYVLKQTKLNSYGRENGYYRILLPSDPYKVTAFGYIAAADVKVIEEKAQSGPDFWGTEEKKYRGIGLDILLGGGVTFFGGGDITDGVRGLIDELNAQLSDEGFAISDKNIGTFRSGAYAYPDLIFHLGPRLSIGIGGEYVSAKNLDTFSYLDRGAFYTANSNSILEAFIIRPGVHITLPLGGVLSVRATGGPIFIKLNFKYNRDYGTRLITENLRLTAKDVAVGFQAGLALEIRLNERVGVFLDAHGQAARATSLEGDEQLLRLSQYGDDLSEPRRSGSVKIASRNGFSVLSIPGQGGLPDSKNAVFDFKGFGFSAGLKFRI